jgi:hypothetical protein
MRVVFVIGLIFVILDLHKLRVTSCRVERQ